MIRISPHFTYRELVRTSHTNLRLYNALSGIPYLPSCFYLCEFLEQLRTFLRRPIRINSGYRCSRLNFLVKGARDSDHLYFSAVDIPVSSCEALDLRSWLSRHDSVRYFKYYKDGYYHISLKRLTSDESSLYSTYYDDSFLLSLYSEIYTYF